MEEEEGDVFVVWVVDESDPKTTTVQVVLHMYIPVVQKAACATLHLHAFDTTY